MTPRLPPFVLLLVVSACGGSVLLAGDASDSEAVDGSADHDAEIVDGPAVDVPDEVAVDVPGDTVPLCPVRTYAEREVRTIEEVTLVDSPGSRLGATDRLQLRIRLRSACEQLASVSLDLLSGGATDFVGLTAYAWVTRGLDCPPSAPLVSRIVSVPGREQGNLRVVVSDESVPGGGIRLEYDRGIPCSGVPACACFPDSPPGTVPEGGPCLTDCSCAAGLSCLAGHGVAGPFTACARPCHDFRDCRADETCLQPTPDALPWICAGPRDQCGAETPCPADFACVAGSGGAPSRCEDRRAARTDSPRCDCDEECRRGERCLVAATGSDPLCAVPCFRDVDCPAGGAFFCGRDAHCLPRE